MSVIDRLFIPRHEAEGIGERFRRTGELTLRKLLEYLPPMLMTNLSVLLLVTVDGVVLGNMVGPEALSAVNVFYPATVLIGTASALLAAGVAAYVSTCVGKNDYDSLRRAKDATKRLLVIFAIAASVIQVPLVTVMIESYNGLTPEVHDMTWQYAIGIMIATPFGLISTTGVSQLQISGKMKVLMWLSVMEGVVNLLLDLLFVGPMNMGVMGGGMGTACANVVRCTTTVLYLAKKTDMYRSGGVKATAADCKELLSAGMPEAANSLMLALQNYFVMMVIINAFGDEGGVIKGVCVFCFSLATVFISGVQGSMRPIIGLVSGTEDWVGVQYLMGQCVKIIAVTVGALTIIVMLFPGWFYALHGVPEMTAVGELSVRLFALHFVFKGCNALFRLYFAVRKDQKFATGLTIVGNATLPVFAFVLTLLFPAPFLWLSYLLTELLIFLLNMWRYIGHIKRDIQEDDPDAKMLSLTVKPEEAVEASREIRRYSRDNGCSKRVSYRMALCVEEMIAYAVESQKRDNVNTQVVVRFSRDSGVLTILDDGECIALGEDKEQQELITNNYDLVKKVAESVDYQYVLGMNHTIIRF